MDLRPEKHIRSLGVGEPVKQEFSWMQYVVIQSAAPKNLSSLPLSTSCIKTGGWNWITAAHKRHRGSQIK